ncbi:MAG: hypothetical protein JO172_04015 [Hyphomicrobiales bacterium]|nr:hypothetical protein [Hyphomicrobiales bacterium]
MIQTSAKLAIRIVQNETRLHGLLRALWGVRRELGDPDGLASREDHLPV